MKPQCNFALCFWINLWFEIMYEHSQIDHLDFKYVHCCVAVTSIKSPCSLLVILLHFYKAGVGFADETLKQHKGTNCYFLFSLYTVDEEVLQHCLHYLFGIFSVTLVFSSIVTFMNLFHINKSDHKWPAVSRCAHAWK